LQNEVFCLQNEVFVCKMKFLFAK